MRPGLTVTILVLCLGVGQGIGGQTVSGRLVESGTETPILLGRVVLVDTTFTIVRETMSDHNGNFTLVAPGPGSYWVAAERIGYWAAADGLAQLDEGGFLPIDFYLRPKPLELEGIVAEVERRRIEGFLEQEGFYDRQEARAGWFMGPDAIEEHPGFDTADLLRDAPFVDRRDIFGQGAVVEMWARGGGRCRPEVYVDGVPFPPQADINDFVFVDNILGVEVYRGAAEIPPQWGMFNNCGVILIWTRAGGLIRR